MTVTLVQALCNQKCGPVQVPEGSTHCPQCGHPLSAPTGAAATATQPVLTGDPNAGAKATATQPAIPAGGLDLVSTAETPAPPPPPAPTSAQPAATEIAGAVSEATKAAEGLMSFIEDVRQSMTAVVNRHPNAFSFNTSSSMLRKMGRICDAIAPILEEEDEPATLQPAPVVQVPAATGAKAAPNREEIKAQIAADLVLAGYDEPEAVQLAENVLGQIDARKADAAEAAAREASSHGTQV